MKTKLTSLFAVACAIAISAAANAQDTKVGQAPTPQSAADVPGPIPGAPLSKEYVQAVG